MNVDDFVEDSSLEASEADSDDDENSQEDSPQIKNFARRRRGAGADQENQNFVTPDDGDDDETQVPVSVVTRKLDKSAKILQCVNVPNIAHAWLVYAGVTCDATC